MRFSVHDGYHEGCSWIWIFSGELSGQFAAVDGDGSTRDVRRLVGCNKHDGLGDLFGSPYAFERHTLDQPGLPFVRTGEPVQHPSLDRTGGDHIYTYTRPRCLKRRRLRQPFDGMLAGNIESSAGCTCSAVSRGNVDDATAALRKHHS